MPKTRLADYIKIVPSFLNGTICEKLIQEFEISPHQDLRRTNHGYSFSQLDVTRHLPEQSSALTTKLSAFFYRYQSELGVRPYWPSRFFYEHLRIQRYLPNGVDAFPTHVDVFNSAAAARFMTIIVYLNETNGGETTFPDLDIAVKPEAGKLLAFPPLWTFPHAGKPVQNVAKYILHTYLLYPPPDDVTIQTHAE